MSDQTKTSSDATVYSSDGLPPLSAPSPPIYPSQKEGEEEGVLVDDGDNIDPMRAFEMFQGKMFFIDGKEDKHGKFKVGPISEESPIQRLTRLRTEVSELEQELSTSSAAENDLMQVANELLSRLASIAAIPSSKELTASVKETVRELDRVPASYPKQEEMTRSDAVDPRLEARLKTLEQAVGGIGGVNARPVLQRLEEVEGMVMRMDEKKLEAAASRAKVIRADLEAAAKARTKFSISSTTTEDSKIISSLHDQLLHIEQISSQIPTVARRLEQLASLHVQAADFSTRLSTAEREVGELERVLGSAEEAMGGIEDRCRENFKKLEGFLERLDERMDAVQRRDAGAGS